MSSRANATLHIPVTGLSCAGCVRRAQSAIEQVEGVAEAAVNLANEQADITLQHNANSNSVIANVAAQLKKAGYPTRVEEVQLSLNGMHCASCVGKVEKALRLVAGVLDARVNLANETARVEFIASTQGADVRIRDLLQAVKQAGYSAEVHEYQQQDQAHAKQKAYQQLKRSFWLAFALTLPVFFVEMGSHFIPLIHQLVESSMSLEVNWGLQFILTSLVMFGPGLRFYK